MNSKKIRHLLINSTFNKINIRSLKLDTRQFLVPKLCSQLDIPWIQITIRRILSAVILELFFYSSTAWDITLSLWCCYLQPNTAWLQTRPSLKPVDHPHDPPFWRSISFLSQFLLPALTHPLDLGILLFLPAVRYGPSPIECLLHHTCIDHLSQGKPEIVCFPSTPVFKVGVYDKH